MSEVGATPDWLRDSDLLARAHAVASKAHRGQPGKDGASPFIRHPLAVAARLADTGHDEPTIAAALLHDVVERSDHGIEEVVARFGVGVGELVSALTDDGTIADYQERKREHRERVAEAGPRAAAIYTADKLLNVGEVRRLYAERGEAAAERFAVPLKQRLELWREDAEMLDRVLADDPLVAQLRAELAGLSADLSAAPESAGAA